MGSWGIKYTEGDDQALIAPARTFDTVTNSPVGGLNYTYSKYRIEISEQPTFDEGVDPAQNNPPTTFDRSSAYSIADYNLENLYDYRNNPYSGCDFAGDSGCPKVDPFLAAVTPPYDYVPASDAAYQARLTDIALQIINDLHSPDILMVQEVENQDICSMSGGALVCDTTVGNPDGKPDVLQDLSLKIAANGGPAYDAAFDPDSSDLRGIAPAFLYRTDRVELVSPVGDPILGASPAIPGYTSVPLDNDISNPKTLNAELPAGISACETSWVFPRAPDIGLFRIYSDNVGLGSFRDVYVINNHFKSGPDTCVAHRTEQAKYNAALVAYIQAANPYARIVVGGDLNVYPQPDDPFAPIGEDGSSDQLGALYEPSLELTNLWDVLLGQAPEAAYSYVYVGMAQTLDQMFVNPLMLADLNQFRIAHINSDFPADYPDDVARGTSDHDPNVATFGNSSMNFSSFYMPIVNLPATNTVQAGQAIPIQFSLDGYQGLDVLAMGYQVSQQIDCVSGTLVGNPEEIKTPGSSGLTYDPITDMYTYVWKTAKPWAGTCRLLTVMLNDGTAQQAGFKFTK
jgi:predicted extracellular nuclease